MNRPESLAIRRVRDGYRADIERRNALIREHAASIARLTADNATDARHADVAQELIDQVDAGAIVTAAWAPASEITAAALIADLAGIGALHTVPATNLIRAVTTA